MRVVNYNAALLHEIERKKNAGEFGYGDFGSATADKIIDESTESWTDAKLREIKGKWRTMVLNLQNAVDARNQAIAAIKAMPAGEAKSLAIGQFQDADGVFMQAYNQAQPLIAEVGAVTGDTFPASSDANFGVAPLIWGVVAGALIAVAYISTTAYNSKLRYDAILQNPEVAKYDQGGGFLSILGGEVGTGIKWGIVALAGLYAASLFMKRTA